jgi:hypothetical protein
MRHSFPSFYYSSSFWCKDPIGTLGYSVVEIIKIILKGGGGRAAKKGCVNVWTTVRNWQGTDERREDASGGTGA